MDAKSPKLRVRWSPIRPKQSTGERWLRPILGFVGLCVLLSTIPVMTYFAGPQPVVIISATAFYLALTLILKSRLILCTLIGILFGFIFQPAPRKTAWKVSQMAAYLAGGVVIGITVGAAWDAPLESRRRNRR